MSEFACPVVSVAVEEHPDADRLEVASVHGYRLVIAKGAFSTGDRAVYLPEGSVLPDSLIEELGLTGRLAGKAANRVKAVRLRGIVSQGLLVPLDSPHLAGLRGDAAPGTDLAAALGVTKWEPPIPVQMQGLAEACLWPSGFDVESWQSFPGLFDSGEPVQVTEKLHGTFCLLGHHVDDGPVASSKGMAGKTSFVLDAPENDNNLYVRAWGAHGDMIREWSARRGESLQVLGEIVGPKVQDLAYGMSRPTFLAFDAKVGGEILGTGPAGEILDELAIPSVPVVEPEIGFDHETILDLAARPSALGGGLREGVVVRPPTPRRDPRIGRVMAKYVNPAFLTRRGGTEHN